MHHAVPSVVLKITPCSPLGEHRSPSQSSSQINLASRSKNTSYTPRFAAYYLKLQTLPRKLRRGLQRQWKQSLAGLALLLTLGQAPALAATINVSGNARTQAVIPLCSLVDAITASHG